MALHSSLIACSVCFGTAEDPLQIGMSMGILTLLAVTGGVLFAFTLFFLHLRRQALKAAPDKRAQSAKETE